jgi:hypothetical protein
MRLARSPKLRVLVETGTPLAVGQEEGPAVAAATKSALTRAGRLGHPLAAVLLIIAKRLEANVDSASGLAALARVFREVVVDLLKDTRTEPDLVDELRTRCSQKFRQADGDESGDGA